MSVKTNNDWDDILKEEFNSAYYKEIRKKLIEEYKNYTVYPDKYDIYNAFKYTSYEDTLVCIIGQDPYHNKGQAHGLCFSVKEGVKPPPSLINIFKELKDDLSIPVSSSGYLKPWADQGVLLLNSVLTVRENSPASHKSLGWEKLSDKIITLLNEKEKPIVFILWGAFAISKKHLITNEKHLVITSVHPSPLSAHRGFFGSKPFSKTNAFLKENLEKEINWEIK